MAPKMNPDLDDGGNGSSNTSLCYQHGIKLAALDERVGAIEDSLEILCNRTAPLPIIEGHLQEISEKCSKFSTQLDEHKIAQDKIDSERDVLLATQKTKTEILWYVIIVVMLGAILAKLVLPAFL